MSASSRTTARSPGAAPSGSTAAARGRVEGFGARFREWVQEPAMNALVFHGPHRLSLENLPEPAPVEGEVKLRVRACGICGSDVHGYTGESGRRVAGQVMGHEFSGEIAALGPGVSGWSIGERVAAYNLI